MFGYIKPLSGELKVREFELYKSFYCGLCKTMGKNISPLSRLTLSYDMVFLALLRIAFIKEPIEKIENKSFRCKLNPLKKRNYIKSSESLLYSSCIAAILTYYKCMDDINDTKNKFKRFLLKIPVLLFAGMKKKACKFYPGLDEKISGPLVNLNRTEKENCASNISIDRPASCFAELMRNIICFGLKSGEQSIIAGQIGWHIGRWLYIADALDDFGKDIKKREYNPFSAYYDKNRNNIVKDIDIIRHSLTSSLHEVNIALSLLESAENSSIMAIIENIINLGMAEQQEKILKKYENKI